VKSAAVAGNVFASPNASQVTRAIELVDGDGGFVLTSFQYAAPDTYYTQNAHYCQVCPSTDDKIVYRCCYRNYTGDVLNFGLAKEEYAASHPEQAHRVKFLVVGDDVSVGKTQGGLVGRR
jgi:triose/dihydroxyacetone kinase / FAD-AMP lyase (cyclizing)